MRSPLTYFYFVLTVLNIAVLRAELTTYNSPQAYPKRYYSWNKFKQPNETILKNTYS